MGLKQTPAAPSSLAEMFSFKFFLVALLAVVAVCLALPAQETEMYEGKEWNVIERFENGTRILENGGEKIALDEVNDRIIGGLAALFVGIFPIIEYHVNN